MGVSWQAARPPSSAAAQLSLPKRMVTSPSGTCLAGGQGCYLYHNGEGLADNHLFGFEARDGGFCRSSPDLRARQRLDEPG
jgi:hypothetical protein